LAMLICQDIIIVPLVLFTPMLAGESDNVLLSLFYMALKGGLVILLTIISAKYLIPQLLYRIAKTKNEELFLLSIIVTCFAVAYATSLLGLSLGLGAFLAGLIISESEYSHHATGKILPFREIFLSFFFVSVGMLFDIGFLAENLLLILALVLLTFLVKFTVTSLAVKSLGSSFKESFIVGFSIFQVGEFSLLLAKEGLKYELLDNTTYQFFLAISILTMIITPFVLKQREKLACRVLNIPMPKKIKDRLEERVQIPEIDLEKESLNDHLVIIGYGLNGRNLARAAKRAKITYVIIEMNPETVKVEAAKGEPIIYGDAGNAVVLEHVKIHKARVAVIAISNQPATTGIIMNIREASQNVFIIVRTRYVNEIESMLNMGADEVIPEEFETSIEIFTRVLNKYLVPKGEVDDFTNDVRFHNYEVFRTPSNESTVPSLDIPEINFSGIKIEKDHGQFIGKSIKESNLRENSGLNLVAIKRGGKTLTEITGHTKIKLGDIVYVVGKPEALESFEEEVGIS
ncbi:cation:proton antiporter, partial [uncultured Cyclobacterium sp.]|uniref:cation:proton antiporter domain-containing protein n=1 Tax=uncultured Cyclobacterium sp. TaxID=453820 RepID=UPI0030EBDC58